jgi:adenosylmethionine-8-amino-7-oxononanoate aminotransferase
VFRHGPTYSGHATCCAAALANIALLGRDRLVERGRELEGALLDALTPFAAHPSVAEVRGGVGLLAAVALTDEALERHPDAIHRVVMAAREDGVLVRPLARAIAVSPPLTVDTEHLTLIAHALERGLAAL